VYAYDQPATAIRRFDAAGNFLAEIHGSGVAGGWIGGQTSIAVDLDGSLWTAAGTEVRHFDAAGALLSRFGSQGTGPALFKLVWGLARSTSGLLYVVDQNNHYVQKFGAAPVPVTRTSWGRLKSLYR
jgi:hypothetical protein